MNKISQTVILVLCWVSIFNAQQPRAKDNKCDSPKKKISLSSSEKSVARIRGLSVVSAIGGNTFIGGYNTEFEKNKVLAYGLLWRISDNEITVKKLSFLSRVDDMFWVDNLTGWVTGIGHGVYKTMDGGETWRKLENSNDIYDGLFFLDTDLGWYFAKDEYLKRLKDGKVERLDFFYGFPKVRRLQFTSPEKGWLLDVINSKSRFQHTNDSGKTWEVVNIAGGEIDDFQFLNDNEGFAIEPAGLFSTNDNGRSWNLIKRQSKNTWISKIFFLDLNLGWTIGRNICFTRDAGIKWNCSDFPEGFKDKEIKDFIFTNASNGWLLTNDVLYFSKDSGNTWQRQHLSFTDVRF